MQEKHFHNVGVLMGGVSGEREVSLRSGAAVARGLREAGYDVMELDITDEQVVLPPDIEAVFLALHGRFGEDGQIQTILRDRRVPYTGSGPESSRRSFDKLESKRVFENAGIPTPMHEILRPGQQRALPLPLVVKPLREGSSLGVFRVVAESEWEEALREVFHFGNEALVETYIPGRELTAGVVAGDALPLVEICAPGGWYDYRAKYTKGATEYVCPAPVNPDIAQHCQDLAVKVFQSLGCEGLGRVDFRLTEGGALYVLEMNNLPGFTETSLLPKAAAAAGMSFPVLCDRIMRTARVK